MNEDLILTKEELDRGWKEIEVETLTGEKQTLRLTGPGWRKSIEIALATADKPDVWLVIEPCLPEPLRSEKTLDRLTIGSIGRIQSVCFAWVNGNAKKNAPVEAPPAATSSTAS